MKLKELTKRMFDSGYITVSDINAPIGDCIFTGMVKDCRKVRFLDKACFIFLYTSDDHLCVFVEFR